MKRTRRCTTTTTTSLLLLLLLSLSLFFLLSALPARGAGRSRLHVIVAYESPPHTLDGAEKYLAAGVRALASLPCCRVTFAYRSASGLCAPSSPADAGALGGGVRAVAAAPGSAAFAALLVASRRTAVLLPLSFFENCDGAPNASAEAYAGALGRAPGRAVAVGVWAFDAQGARAAGVAALEPAPAQAARYARAAAELRAREAALYGAADVLAMLTPEDHAATAELAGAGVARVVTHFREDAAPALRAPRRRGGPPPPLPRQRALAAAAALPPRSARDGFCFLGGGNNPTNILALHALLNGPWAAIRGALPGAALHVIGPPPRALCRAHGVWCSWTEHSPWAALPSNESGVVVRGAVDDLEGALRGCAVALAPMTCGTGVNTKVHAYLNAGLPTVATQKAARGYFLPPGAEPLPGLAVTPNDLRGFARAAVALHEAGAAAWAEASLSVLEHAAALADTRDAAEDFAALAAALGAAADART